MIRIGHSSIDENGKISGGQAGDSTNKEVCVRTWYSKPWQYYLECIDDTIANIAATYMEQICNNLNVGYDQKERLTLYNQLKTHKDVSKLTPCECDCSSLVACCYIMAGLNINPSCTTRSLRSALMATGKFKAYSDSEHLTNDKCAKRGGIYLTEGSHVIMALENGDISANINTIISTERKGIDVSSYQGTIDWKKVKADGVEFSILKVIRKDLNPDKQFENNWKGCMNNNLDIEGVYNYSYAVTVEKAKSDAQKVIQILNGRKTTVYLDVEDNCQKGLGQLLIDIILAYQKIIESAGLEFAVYSGLSFYNSYIKPYAIQLNCDFWIARYPSNNRMLLENNPPCNKKPNIVHNLYGWQFSSKGSVDGIEGNVDLNIAYKNNKMSKTSLSSISNRVQESVNNVVNKMNSISNVTPSSIAHFTNYVATESSNLNVRTRSGNQFLESGKSLKKGTQIKAYDAYNGWVKIDAKENKWCSAEYISSNFVGIINECSALNFRDVDSKDGNVLETLKSGEQVKLFAQSIKTNWVLTEYGWCNPDYLSITQN